MWYTYREALRTWTLECVYFDNAWQVERSICGGLKSENKEHGDEEGEREPEERRRGKREIISDKKRIKRLTER